MAAWRVGYFGLRIGISLDPRFDGCQGRWEGVNLRMWAVDRPRSWNPPGLFLEEKARRWEKDRKAILTGSGLCVGSDAA